jgi:hypothetical protein
MLLEKTPKNALRIPFLARVFAGARYVFLWRDPRPSIHSIIRAWESGRWRTYAGLPGFDGPWSLLLPPGWRHMRGRPLAQVAAFQWDAANRLALDDLAALPEGSWIGLDYQSLVADPAAAITRVMQFTGLAIDAALQSRLAAPLPLSRQTLSAPDPQKWRELEAEIEAVLPMVEETWARLRASGAPQPGR